MMELTIRDHLEVAHFMKEFPEGHPNRRLHGHSYSVIVTARSTEDVDMIVDFDEFKQALSGVLKEFDHTCVNDWLGSSSPTMENMCRFLWSRIKVRVPALCRIELERPTLGMSVVYEGRLS